MDYSSFIGESIAHYRTERGLTSSELANKAGLSQSSISQYEAGNRSPSEKALLKVAKALNMSVDELIQHASTLSDNAPELRLLKRKEAAAKNADFVIELSETLLITGDLKLIDLSKDEPPKALDHLVVDALKEVTANHSDEIARILSERLAQLNSSANDVIDGMKKK